MVTGVLTHKPESIYDDAPWERYHFPRTYLSQVREMVGDWFVYYEPRRIGMEDGLGGRQAYFAVGRLMEIDPDPSDRDHFYARVQDYLEFDHPVPFRQGAHYHESALRKVDGSTNRGAFGRSVRTMPRNEFELIVETGFAQLIGKDDDVHMEGFTETPAEPFNRPIVEQVLRRPFRDRAFKLRIRQAYNNTCAVTGLNIINGGGRPEVEAAHIVPVSEHGPDTIRNGLALSGTVHWMFDRGLISIDENYNVMAAKGVPDQMRRIFREEGVLLLPKGQTNWPSQKYLEFHRANIFKG